MIRTALGRHDLTCTPPSYSRASRRKRQLLSRALKGELDRVNVLGSETTGHTGCVNALSWARDGELLLSGGDDTTVRIWRSEDSDKDHDYPFTCRAKIHTGHRANIFNAHMLPGTSRIATVAGDRQVRVFDLANAVGRERGGGPEPEYDTSSGSIRTLKCHTGRTKRIVTEASSDRFLTVAEDGQVREHDLRTTHKCNVKCPAPLIKLPHDLSAIAVSPLAPHHIVVAGESSYGYLFDRRQSGRHILEEWGREPDSGLTSCVRRFGRITRGPGERAGHEHVTGARMAQHNDHEVLLSYSADAVYLFSTRDDAETPSEYSAILKANIKGTERPAPRPAAANLPNTSEEELEEDAEQIPSDLMDVMAGIEVEQATDEDSDSERSELERGEHGMSDVEDDDSEDSTSLTRIPVVLPRRRFVGACNVETVKDVNFLGPTDEFVASGSDDGNFFLWKKSTGQLHGVYEGDGSVVNVIEGHPHLPLIAVSGIDTTVKLFGPAHRSSAFARMSNSDNIMQRNADAAERSAARQVDLASLFLHNRLILRHLLAEGEEGEEPEGQCPTQ